jgi:hypothetical protein
MNFRPIYIFLNPEIITCVWIISIIFASILFDEEFIILVVLSIFLYWIMLSIFIHIKLRDRFKNIQNSMLTDGMESPIEIGLFHSKTGIHTSLLYGIIPVLLIISPILYMININKSDIWTKPFANTFGYLFFNNRLQKESDDIFKQIDGRYDVLKENIVLNNKSIFLNSLKSNLNDSNIINENAGTILSLFYYLTGKDKLDDELELRKSIQDNMCKIQKVINNKYKLSNVIWYIISGSLVSLAVRYHVNNIALDAL